MKTSKAQIYAKYGITYKNGKIETPIGPMCELLKRVIAKPEKMLGHGQ